MNSLSQDLSNSGAVSFSVIIIVLTGFLPSKQFQKRAIPTRKEGHRHYNHKEEVVQ